MVEGFNGADAISSSPTRGRPPTLLSTSTSKFGGQVSVHRVLMCQVLFATHACMICPCPSLPASLPLSHFLFVTVHCPLCQYRIHP